MHLYAGMRNLLPLMLQLDTTGLQAAETCQINARGHWTRQAVTNQKSELSRLRDHKSRDPVA